MASFSETPLMEIILRRYESPHQLSQRETLKKICLALGLLQPGDSRDVIVDILLVLEQAKQYKRELSAIEIKEELIEQRKQHGLSLNGTADSNIRRQLKRLRDVFLVEKVRNNYRILEYMPLSEIFEEKIKKIILEAILKRNEEYFAYYEQFEKNENNA
jgi:DNA-binding transcriptional ArsR family regulator